jgi:hypothetical protein
MDVELLDPEPVTDRQGVRGFQVKQLGLQIERVRQAMGRVDAHYQCAIAEHGKFDASGGGQAGLADTALTGEHEDPHSPIVRAACTAEFWSKKRR